VKSIVVAISLRQEKMLRIKPSPGSGDYKEGGLILAGRNSNFFDLALHFGPPRF